MIPRIYTRRSVGIESEEGKGEADRDIVVACYRPRYYRNSTRERGRLSILLMETVLL